MSNMPEYSQSKILVLGDIILDRYWQGSTSRISPEAPVPIISVEKEEERAGGAGNVVTNIASLGAKVKLISRVGVDSAAERLKVLLSKKGTELSFHASSYLPTVTKLRVLGQNQQLLRMDFEQSFQGQDIMPLLDDFEKELASFDAVVLSDYGKGTLSDAKLFIDLAKSHGIPVLVDPKGNDFSRYHGATMVTPNLKEFEAVVGACIDKEAIVAKGYTLMAEHEIESLLITRGKHGMTLLKANEAPLHLPAKAREVYDVTGAGDTVIAVMAATIAAKKSFGSAAKLANTAAGLVVGKLGTAQVSVAELRRELKREQGVDYGCTTQSEILMEVSDARDHNETIVMTNGCFDILHRGHITYLEQAKALGHRLIVAVNDDASVARLKGKERPLNTLQDRMAMLSALRAVDWVVPFSEDTPLFIISQVLPDVLVKGGDYVEDEIAGAIEVKKNGGEIKILDFVEGCSTTGLIEKIRNEKTKGEKK